jgi:nicotinamidase/pyrazinamidase
MPETAFLDIDTQFDFMSPGGALYFKNAETIIPNLERLVEAAHQMGVPLISSVDAHFENDPEFGEWVPHAVAGTPGQKKIPETTLDDVMVFSNGAQPIALRPGAQVVIEKRIYSLFDNLNTEVILRAIGAHEFVVFGVPTEYCVKATVMALLERGYRVRLVTDAITPVTKPGGRVAIGEMTAAGAKLATADEIIATL